VENPWSLFLRCSRLNISATSKDTFSVYDGQDRADETIAPSPTPGTTSAKAVDNHESGFSYVSHICWIKDRPGTGYWVRNEHELLLIGKREAMRLPLK